jgi:hypothetical protein
MTIKTHLRSLCVLVVAFVLFVPSAGATGSCQSVTRTLSLGSRDSGMSKDVSMLQECLRSRNHLATMPTGYFGPQTAAAVRAYQAKAGIEQTGTVGPKTLASLRVQSSGEIPAPIKAMLEAQEETVSYASVFAGELTVSGTDDVPGGAMAFSGTNVLAKNGDASADVQLKITTEDEEYFEGPLSVDLSLRLIGKDDLYFSFNKGTSVPFLDLKRFYGKWVRITGESGMDEFPELSTLLTPTSVDEFMAAHNKYPAFNFTEEAGSSSEYEYSFSSDVRTLIQLAGELSGEEISDEELEEIPAGTSLSGNLFIDKKTSLPVSIELTTEFSMEEAGTVSIEYVQEFSDYGKNLKVQKPTKSMSFEAFIETLLEDAFETFYEEGWNESP